MRNIILNQCLWYVYKDLDKIKKDTYFYISKFKLGKTLYKSLEESIEIKVIAGNENNFININKSEDDDLVEQFKEYIWKKNQ